MANDPKVTLGEVFGEKLRGVKATPAPAPRKPSTNSAADSRVAELLDFDFSKYLEPALEREAAQRAARERAAEEHAQKRKDQEAEEIQRREAERRNAIERQQEAFLELAGQALANADDLRNAAAESVRANEALLAAQRALRSAEDAVRRGKNQVERLSSDEIRRLMAAQESLSTLATDVKDRRQDYDRANRAHHETESSVKMLRSARTLASLMEVANRKEDELRSNPSVARGEVVRAALSLQEVNFAAELIAPEEHQRDAARRAVEFWAEVAAAGRVPAKSPASRQGSSRENVLRSNCAPGPTIPAQKAPHSDAGHQIVPSSVVRSMWPWRNVTSGKRFAIVGGHPRPERIRYIKDEFGCELEWLQKESSSAQVEALVQRIRNGTVDVVFVLKAFNTHNNSTRIFGERRADVAVISVDTYSLLQLKLALERDLALPARAS